MESNQVSLAWKDFQQCAGEAFKQLFDDSDLTDVTLACADSIQIKAHKLILCASSPFFKGVLSKNSHSHPLLYLKGINGKTMESILSFMYQGEAKVLESDIKAFLDTAEEFKIKGLCDINQDYSPPYPSSTEINMETKPIMENLENRLNQSLMQPQSPIYVEESLQEKSEGGSWMEPQSYSNYQDYSNQSMIRCPQCSFEATTAVNLSIHTKNFHPIQKPQTIKPKPAVKKETVRCNICQMVLINERKQLLDHCKVYHGA